MLHFKCQKLLNIKYQELLHSSNVINSENWTYLSLIKSSNSRHSFVHIQSIFYITWPKLNYTHAIKRELLYMAIECNCNVTVEAITKY